MPQAQEASVRPRSLPVLGAERTAKTPRYFSLVQNINFNINKHAVLFLQPQQLDRYLSHAYALAPLAAVTLIT